MSLSSIFAVVFALLGVVFGLVAVVVAVSRRRFVARATRIDGVVIGSRTSRRGNGARRRTVYAPVVRYAFEGATYEVPGSVGYDTPRALGTRIVVLVDPTRPRVPLLDERPELWSTVVMSGATSLVFLTMAGVVLALELAR
jgi:hypothetical protein